ncbi:SurA N-terminal domain-containing protein [Desulfobacterales bacterium HSG16]|nr:SurA N-terminal domain-containing protein [Desulfobacterales bacterium HSG16]
MISLEKNLKQACRKYKKNKWLVLITLLSTLIVFSCSASQTEEDIDGPLIQVGEITMSLTEFNQVFEIAKSAYPYDTTKNSEALEKVSSEIMDQMIERMVLIQLAKEQGMTISDAALLKRVKSLKQGYTDQEFEKALLESAVSYHVWEKELKVRLLIEKVISVEMKNLSQMAANPATSGQMDENLVKVLKQNQMQKAYGIWIRQLQESYTIKIDRKLWNRVTDSVAQK